MPTIEQRITDASEIIVHADGHRGAVAFCGFIGRLKAHADEPTMTLEAITTFLETSIKENIHE